MPRKIITIEPDCDVSSLKRIGIEVTETLAYIPAQLYVNRWERRKYVDPARPERGVIMGDLPARLIDKGIAEPELLANVTIAKYVDHLPLYRQQKRFDRVGILLPTSTLGDWICQTARSLIPLYDALKREVLRSGYLQADETTISVQDRQKTKKGKNHRGYYWMYMALQQGLVVAEYRKGRARAGPVEFLADFRGALQTDGYVVYDIFNAHTQITTYGCWSHARRYFFKARATQKVWAAFVLKRIRQLYAVEHTLKGCTPSERYRVRQAKSVPILQELKRWLDTHAGAGLPKSPWSKAVHYTLARWDKLTRFVHDGRIEIDNNLIENSIRPIALGRKNYLFAGSHDAAQRAAVIYSLLGTCKQHNVNPEAWLSDVLRRIPTHPQEEIHELLPHRWQAPTDDVPP